MAQLLKVKESKLGLCYQHLLIPTNPGFRASSDSIASFLEGLIELEVVGDAPKISGNTLKRVTPKARRGCNPLTGEVIEIQGPTRLPDRTLILETIRDLPTAVDEAAEYNVRVSNVTTPKLPPLPIEFDGPYHLQISCCVRGQTVSMCCAQDAAESSPPTVRFLNDCSDAQTAGRFTDPHTGSMIEVPNAGCARFWVDFELGKFLLPEIKNGDLLILNPRIVVMAKNCFKVEFAQGCVYG